MLLQNIGDWHTIYKNSQAEQFPEGFCFAIIY